MKRVYVDMVADLFHSGHVAFLRRARRCGDALVVGVHSDEAVASYKRRPIMTMEERIDVVRACRYVDEVLPNAPLTVDREWIEKHAIDVVAHGDDLSETLMEQFYRVPLELGIMQILPYTPGVSTSDLIERVLARRETGEQPSATGRSR
jgi:cytidyltransferase-like protein